MTDLIFYWQKKIYVYYNMHAHLDFTGGLDEIYLCINWDETSYSPIFDNFASLSQDDIKLGGNSNIVI